MPSTQAIAIKTLTATAAFLLALPAFAQTTTPSAKYPTMVPLAQYLMDQPAEIALARTAAPASISGDADIMVLKPHGYETIVHGKNGFVCIVERSFTGTTDDEFFNPKVRVPMCLNGPAVRSYLPRILKITNLALAGHSLAEADKIEYAAVASKELPPMEPGNMTYMMGKEGYGGAVNPHWPSHVMFFFTGTAPDAWGANLPGSPVIGIADPDEHITAFAIPVQHWSDGTLAPDASLTPHHHQ